MKPLLLTTIFFILTICSYSQNVEELKTSLFVAEQISGGVDTVQADFETKFESADDKRNFKKLREYWNKKKNLLEIQTGLRETFDNLRKDLEKDLENIRSAVRTLKSRVSPLNDTAKVAIESFFGAPNILKYFDLAGLDIKGEKRKRDMTEIYPKLDSVINYVSNKLYGVNSTIDLINSNMLNISADISACSYTLDDALDPEHLSLAMKIKLGYIALAIFGIALLGILVVLMLKKPDETRLRLVFGDSGLQFFTIFAIMITLILFGLLNILEGKELAAILAAIAGYILGRGSRQGKDTNGAFQDTGKTKVVPPGTEKPKEPPPGTGKSDKSPADTKEAGKDNAE